MLQGKDMKYLSSLVNALLLVVLGIWGYVVGGSITALIPVVFGVILLILYPGVKKEAMVPAHIAVLLTLIIVIALLKPLGAAFDRSDGPAIFSNGTHVHFIGIGFDLFH